MKKTFKNILVLGKQTVAALDGAEMINVKGGFTWSLSNGDSCRKEKEFT